MKKEIKKGDIWVVNPQPLESRQYISCLIAVPDLHLETNPKKPHGEDCDCIRLDHGWELIYDEESKCYKKLIEE